METISQATVRDIPELVQLLAELFALEPEFAPDAARQERGLRLILERPEVGRIFCARGDGRVAGMVSLLFGISTAEGGLVAWVEDMVVREGRRGQGIGKRLLDHAAREARALGCSRLTLLTDGSNVRAMRFYERAGFVRSRMVPFRRMLGESEEAVI